MDNQEISRDNLDSAQMKDKYTVMANQVIAMGNQVIAMGRQVAVIHLIAKTLQDLKSTDIGIYQAVQPCGVGKGKRKRVDRVCQGA